MGLRKLVGLLRDLVALLLDLVGLAARCGFPLLDLDLAPCDHLKLLGRACAEPFDLVAPLNHILKLERKLVALAFEFVALALDFALLMLYKDAALFKLGSVTQHIEPLALKVRLALF